MVHIVIVINDGHNGGGLGDSSGSGDGCDGYDGLLLCIHSLLMVVIVECV